MKLELVAPAKINLTLEVLGRRPDGYHEIASLMQTVDLCDRVRLEPGPRVSIKVVGSESGNVPADETNLAYRAAAEIAKAAGKEDGSVLITLEKHIPAGAGLGGGSSDAAAVMRGLNRFWELKLSDAELAAVAARLGSDVPFFLRGGAAECRGRGEIVRPLNGEFDAELTLFPARSAVPFKTAYMYSLLRPEDFSDGKATASLAQLIERGLPPPDFGLRNAFDRACLAGGIPPAQAMALCREAEIDVHAAGSGPSFFALLPLTQLPTNLEAQVAELGLRPIAVRPLARSEALEIEEL